MSGCVGEWVDWFWLHNRRADGKDASKPFNHHQARSSTHRGPEIWHGSAMGLAGSREIDPEAAAAANRPIHQSKTVGSAPFVSFEQEKGRVGAQAEQETHRNRGEILQQQKSSPTRARKSWASCDSQRPLEMQCTSFCFLLFWWQNRSIDPIGLFGLVLIKKGQNCFIFAAALCDRSIGRSASIGLVAYGCRRRRRPHPSIPLPLPSLDLHQPIMPSSWRGPGRRPSACRWRGRRGRRPASAAAGAAWPDDLELELELVLKD